MHRVLCYLALAVLPVPGQVGSIGLYYRFQHQPPKPVFDSLRQEATSLMSPAGLHLQWKALPSSGDEVSTEVAVLTFRGRCDLVALANTTNQSDRLGWSEMSDGAVLPFAGIDCDSIRGFILKKLLTLPSKDRERVLGRAVARVLVHELDHIFAETKSHGSRSVDQPTYTVDELVGDSLDPEQSPVHILQPAPASARAPLRSSAADGRSVFVQGGCSNCHGATGEGSRRGPVLRAAGRILNTVMLATRLARDERKMCQRARSLKLPAPTLSEAEIQDLVTFLNTLQ